jgi:hypothetical protein
MQQQLEGSIRRQQFRQFDNKAPAHAKRGMVVPTGFERVSERSYDYAFFMCFEWFVLRTVGVT